MANKKDTPPMAKFYESQHAKGLVARVHAAAKAQSKAEGRLVTVSEWLAIAAQMRLNEKEKKS